jgi:hypothetical protein
LLRSVAEGDVPVERYLPHDKVMRNLEILAEDVLPQLDARGHRVDATARVCWT